MLNRRILRIKVFKALYACAEDRSRTLKEAQAGFEASCEAVRDLYLYMLSFIAPLTAEARKRIDAAARKFHPTEEDLHPNTKFADNALAPLFNDDEEFQKLLKKKKLDWEQQDVLIRNVYDSVRSKDWFAAYLDDPERSLQRDVKLFIRIFEEEFVDNQELEQILEDLNIWWTDDLAYALNWCCRSLEDIARTGRWSYPPLYQSELLRKKDPDVESDKDFADKLLRCAYARYDEYAAMVAASVGKWDKDRLFTTDVVLIALGLTEAENFPEIPVKVSINEYVEISKYYSTPKSRAFVNGLLDRLVQQLEEAGRIARN